MNKLIKSLILVGVSVLPFAALADSAPDAGQEAMPSITLPGGKVLNAANVNTLSEPEKKEAVRQIFKAGRPFVLYNFTSKQREVIDDPVGLSKEKAREFVPPIPEVLSMFELYAEQGPAYSALLNTYAEYQKSLNQ